MYQLTAAVKERNNGGIESSVRGIESSNTADLTDSFDLRNEFRDNPSEYLLQLTEKNSPVKIATDLN